MKLSMIAAMGKNRVIGMNNQMPWHLPADLQWFKKTTLGKPIIMGRKTYDSIGRSLPGRLNIVLSRDSDLVIEGCTVVNSIDKALEVAEAEAGIDEVFITGGWHLYQQCLEKADRLYLTLIDKHFEGDTYFPDYTNYEWQEVVRQEHAADAKNPYALTFLVLKKIRNHSNLEAVQGH